MKLRTLFAVGLSAILLSGCNSYKKVPYLQDTYVKSEAQASHSMYDAKIMPKDLLTITVNTTDPEAEAADLFAKSFPSVHTLHSYAYT